MKAIPYKSDFARTPRDEHLMIAYERAQRERFGDNWDALLRPDGQRGESIITRKGLQSISLSITTHSHGSDAAKLEDFIDNCWREILANRSYEIPSKGRAEIRVSANVAKVTKIRALRLIQESVSAPGAYVRFEFSDPAGNIGILKIEPSGAITGFSSEIGMKHLHLMFSAIALAFYRDLVTPELSPIQNRIAGRHVSRTRTKESSQKSERHLPREKTAHLRYPRIYPFQEWYVAQERARHLVVGHSRWVGNYFQADDERKVLAKAAMGVQLKSGYTWITEHERGQGSPDGIGMINFDLASHTIFAPPERATRELRKLLR